MKKLSMMIPGFLFAMVLAGALTFAAEYEAPKTAEPSGKSAPAATQPEETQPEETQPARVQPQPDDTQPAQANQPSDETAPDQSLPEGSMAPVVPETQEK